MKIRILSKSPNKDEESAEGGASKPIVIRRDLLEEDRYQRFRLIRWWDQEILRNSRVLVIGAGALGNEVLKNLALLGVGQIVLFDLDNDSETTYQIVGTDEADLKVNKISFESPIARSIIGKSVGDEVTVSTPKGPRNYEISDVSFQ